MDADMFLEPQDGALSQLSRHNSLLADSPRVCSGLPRTSSSCLFVSSSILRMSSIVRSTHLSSQQNSCRWKFVNRRLSCYKKEGTQVRTGRCGPLWQPSCPCPPHQHPECTGKVGGGVVGTPLANMDWSSNPSGQ